MDCVPIIDEPARLTVTPGSVPPEESAIVPMTVAVVALVVCASAGTAETITSSRARSRWRPIELFPHFLSAR